MTDPGKIVCVGLNYKAHAEEAGEKLPTKPILFNKYNNTLAAHNCTIKLPPREVSTKFDYETELVIVIGKTARNVSEANALDYVAGYAVGHDFSARDLQLESGGQWMVGKTLDMFAPIGPYFVSADQVDPNNLLVETFVNDEKEPRQHMSTSQVHLQSAEGDLLHLKTVCAGARRHHLHRHAVRRDHRHAEGQAGLAEGRRQDHQPDRQTGDAEVRVGVRASGHAGAPAAKAASEPGIWGTMM